MARERYQDWITEEGLLKIEGWARDGLAEEQIAEKMGVSRKTLFNWKKHHLPILHALKKGKEVVDREVENALHKAALEGNTTAQIFWLKNRKPEVWRDKQDIEHSGGMNNTVTELTPEERRKRIDELKAKLK